MRGIRGRVARAIPQLDALAAIAAVPACESRGEASDVTGGKVPWTNGACGSPIFSLGED